MRRTAALLLLLAAGCHAATLEVTLTSSPITDEDPFAGVERLELRWPSGAIDHLPFERGATLRLTPPPQARDGLLEIAVVAGGTVVGLGRTAIRRSQRTATAYVGRVNRFVSVAGGGPIQPRFGATATLLAGGDVLFAGGATRGSPGLPDAASITAALELYHPGTGRFAAVPPQRIGERIYHAAVALADGGALLAGGLGKFGASDEIVHVAADGSASVIGHLPSPRYAAAAYGDGSSLALIGGYTAPDGMGGGTLATDAVVVDQSGNVTSFPLPSPRAFAVAEWSPGGVLVTGGVDTTGPRDDALLYRGPRSSGPMLSPLAPTAGRARMLSPRVGHTATRLDPDGRILIYGGNDGRASVAAPELWSPVDGGFVDLPPYNLTGREHHAAVTLGDGSALLVGGEHVPQRMAAPSPVRELLEFAGATLTVDARPTPARADAGVVLLGDGSVLYAGGAVDDPRTVAGGAQIWVSCLGACLTPAP